jgi:hypothetical protein
MAIPVSRMPRPNPAYGAAQESLVTAQESLVTVQSVFKDYVVVS